MAVCMSISSTEFSLKKEAIWSYSYHADVQREKAKATRELNKMLSYRGETALQGGLVMAQNGILELGDNTLWTYGGFRGNIRGWS